MPHRLRRLGSASAAVTAGALVLLPPAPAANAATADTCKKGTDLASTIDNLACNLGNLRDALLPASPAPPPKPTPPKKPQKPAPGNNGAEAPEKAPRKPPPAASAPRGRAPSTMTNADGLAPYTDGPPHDAPLPPGALPVPEVAKVPDTDRPPGTVAAPRTHLISPVAASGNDSGQTPWVAAAAGAAGAVAALNLSVAGRALRRRAAGR
ncbi:hypothetical protein [Actinomadura sp. 9N215]|uniref:hypothetical protein n=1 Tax=Actinomadura sp. 9N215 TaxID=3375150 RepID=UPI00379866FC